MSPKFTSIVFQCREHCALPKAWHPSDVWAAGPSGTCPKARVPVWLGGSWDAAVAISILCEHNGLPNVRRSLGVAVLQLIAGLTKTHLARFAHNDRIVQTTKLARLPDHLQALVLAVDALVARAAELGAVAARASQLRLRHAARLAELRKGLPLVQLMRTRAVLVRIAPHTKQVAVAWRLAAAVRRGHLETYAASRSAGYELPGRLHF